LPVADTEETVAVNVTSCPYNAGFGVAISVMLVGVEPAKAGVRAAAPSQKLDPTRILAIFKERDISWD
jgi:hypothetical protein